MRSSTGRQAERRSPPEPTLGTATALGALGPRGVHLDVRQDDEPPVPAPGGPDPLEQRRVARSGDLDKPSRASGLGDRLFSLTQVVKVSHDRLDDQALYLCTALADGYAAG